MIKLQRLMTESLMGKYLISVDIQPEYKQSFGFEMGNFCNFLNNEYDELSSLTFLYNGKNTLNMISEDEYKMWLIESGCNEEVVHGAYFYDKGYAYFHYCIDANLDDDVVANFVRFMYMNGVNDSRDMDRELWTRYLREYRRTDRREVYDLLKVSNDCVHIPELMDYLKRYRGNIVLTGGGINECLKEVEIALKALRVEYSVYNKFTY